MEKTITVKALKRLISESSNEFKAVLGPNVEKDNKSINGKAYSEAKKRAKDYDGGLEDEIGGKRVKFEKNDANKTTLDYTPENVNDDYKKRVKAQVKGYTSEQEMNNGIEKTGDFSNNENIYDGIKDSGKKIHKAEDEYKFTKVQVRDENPKPYSENEMYESKSGYDMRQMIDRLANFEKNQTPINETKNVKTVYFKKTAFLTEEHMFSRIPDEFKNEGNTFKMKDKTGNEYLVEWRNNKGNIIGHTNKQGFNESIEEMKKLYNYTSSDSKTTLDSRLNESENFNLTLANARKIIK